MLVQRLGNNADNAEYIDGLIRELKKHKGCCDEIWLATDYGYPSVKSAREKAKALKKTADVLRENGFKVSLQVSNTFGHGLYISSKDCSGLVYNGSPVKKMTDVSGVTCDYCFCWNDEFFKKYIIDIISEYALIEPDTLWFDDDLRFFFAPALNSFTKFAALFMRKAIRRLSACNTAISNRNSFSVRNLFLKR